MTLYGAFDHIAKEMGVFKVETVGDCYLAATGIPEPSRDHAVVMTKFAVECLSVMDRLTAALAPILGAETSSLSLRIGMHSGPVIGGVLRGDKSRFQLFGDTINTASRMESTGQAGRIQLSQETANLIITAGKEGWITPRGDPVLAKGKGYLQTYWMVGNSGTHSNYSSSEEAHYNANIRQSR